MRRLRRQSPTVVRREAGGSVQVATIPVQGDKALGHALGDRLSGCRDEPFSRVVESGLESCRIAVAESRSQQWMFIPCCLHFPLTIFSRPWEVRILGLGSPAVPVWLIAPCSC